MKGFLIRVGIDTTSKNIGYCAPVFPDNSFEYIPLPELDIATSEKHTYGSLESRNQKYGGVLSDFMHEDKHEYVRTDGEPFYHSLDENYEPLLAKDLTPHFDPEFETNTFGDFWMKSGGRTGRIPQSLKQGDIVFFYSGLSEYSAQIYKSRRTWHKLKKYQIHKKCVFLTGFLKIQKIFDIRNKNDILKYSSEIQNNAHYKFYEGDQINCVKYNLPMAILKGDDESRLLRKAIRLNVWDPELRKYSPTDFGERIGLKPLSGVRIMKWLNESRCSDILDVIDRND